MIHITYTTGPAPRPKPKAGDRRTTKKHGLQIRVHSRARDNQGNVIGLLVHGSRPVWEWRKPNELEKFDEYLLTVLEKAEVQRMRDAAAIKRAVDSVRLFA